MAFLIRLTAMLFQNEAKLIDELQASLEKQYMDQLEKAQEQWKEDEIKRINDELLKQKDQLLKVCKIFMLALYTGRMRMLLHCRMTDAGYLNPLKTVKNFCDASRAALSLKLYFTM